MIKLRLNGEDVSQEDANILINNSGAEGTFEVMFFTDKGEVRADNMNSKITADIEINCEHDLESLIDRNDNADANIKRIKHAFRTLKKDFKKLTHNYNDLKEQYTQICESVFNERDKN